MIKVNTTKTTGYDRQRIKYSGDSVQLSLELAYAISELCKAHPSIWALTLAALKMIKEEETK